MSFLCVCVCVWAIKLDNHAKAYYKMVSFFDLNLKSNFIFLFQKKSLKGLPKFLYGGLLLPCDNYMSRIVDGKEEDVPVAAEPGDEEWTGEWLEG